MKSRQALIIASKLVGGDQLGIAFHKNVLQQTLVAAED
jgi:hypothetical protein